MASIVLLGAGMCMGRKLRFIECVFLFLSFLFSFGRSWMEEEEVGEVGEVGEEAGKAGERLREAGGPYMRIYAASGGRLGSDKL